MQLLAVDIFGVQFGVGVANSQAVAAVAMQAWCKLGLSWVAGAKVLGLVGDGYQPEARVLQVLLQFRVLCIGIG